MESGKVSGDVVEVEPNFAHTACDKGWAEKLDTSIVDTSGLNPEEVTDCAIPVLEYAFTIGYNTDKFAKDHPTTWAEFFDTKKFPGKRGFWKYATGAIFEAALLADGVAPDDLYPLDIDRAIAKLNTIKDDLVFWTSGAESEDLVGSGEVAMVMTYNSRAYDVKNVLGKPVDYTFRDQILAASYLSVPKGTKNKDAAMELIAYAVGSESNGNPSKYLPLAPSNTGATPDAEMEKDLPTAHLDEPHAQFDDVWIAENQADVEAAYQEWRSSL